MPTVDRIPPGRYWRSARLTLAGMLAGVMLTGAGHAQEVVVEVDPAGRERLPVGGTATAARFGPVRSLEAAVALAREVRRRRPAVRDIAIVLAPGVHRIEQPVRLGREDGGSAGAPLVIRGSPDGTSVLRGSVAIDPEPGPIRGYRRLPPPARAKARIYRLPERLAAVRHIDTPQRQGSSVLIERFAPQMAPNLPFEIFDASGALRAARWPNTGWAAAQAPAGDGWWGFVSDAPRLEAWRGEPDLWAAGHWKWDYAYERHLVREVGAGRLIFTTPLSMGLEPAARYRVLHALAELDTPGEWYRDHAVNALIAWPRHIPERLEVSVAQSAIVAEDAKHIRITDLTMERFVGDGVRIVGGHDVVIERSTIRWTGLRGASFLGARESGIAASDITDTGEGGVLLAGGDRQSLAPGGLFVRSCRIVRFARIGFTFRPAIDMTGVGNIAAGNYIAQAPNFAIQLQGNDHLVEGNEITDVVNDTTDAGAIYTGHDWTARGTEVRHNFLHDIKGQRSGFETKGIYLDDFASGLTIHRNLFLRVEQPVFIGGGRDNLVEGNVFIAAQPAVHIDARGLEWAAKSVDDPASELRARLSAVPTAAEPWRRRYPQLQTLLGDEPGAAKRNVSRGNVVIAGRSYRLAVLASAHKQTLGPDHVGDSSKALPVDAAMVGALLEARTAVEVGALLATGLAALGGPSLPFGAMDRADRAGRPGQRTR